MYNLFQVEVHEKREALLDLIRNMYLNSKSVLMIIFKLHVNLEVFS